MERNSLQVSLVVQKKLASFSFYGVRLRVQVPSLLQVDQLSGHW